MIYAGDQVGDLTVVVRIRYYQVLPGGAGTQAQPHMVRFRAATGGYAVALGTTVLPVGLPFEVLVSFPTPYNDVGLRPARSIP
jgi:hypothetical protein